MESCSSGLRLETVSQPSRRQASAGPAQPEAQLPLAAQPAEHGGLLRWRAGTAFVRRDPREDLIHVIATSTVGGLVALLAHSGTTHQFLLGSSTYCMTIYPRGYLCKPSRESGLETSLDAFTAAVNARPGLRWVVDASAAGCICGASSPPRRISPAIACSRL